MENKLDAIVDELLASYHLEQAPDRTRQDILHVKFYFEMDEIYLRAIEIRGLVEGPIKSVPIKEIGDDVRKIIDYAISNHLSDFPFLHSDQTHWNQVLPKIRADTLVGLNDYLHNQKIKLFLFPLTAITLQNPLSFKNFALHTSASFEALATATEGRTLSPQFRTIISASSTWLEVQSPNKFHANSLKRLILGSLALASLPQYRYQENLAVAAKNYFIIDKSLSLSSSSYHTPSLSIKFEVQVTDFEWLSKIEQLIDGHIESYPARALKYFYRAWFESDHDRMATLFSCIDVFSNKIPIPASQTTECETGKIAAKKPFIEAIRADANLNEKRLGLLYKIRSDISHGRSPNVYESKEYLEYVRKYKFEPLADLEAIAELMLRKRVFENQIPARSNPFAALISKAKNEGILPTEQISRSILFDLDEV